MAHLFYIRFQRLVTYDYLNIKIKIKKKFIIYKFIIKIKFKLKMIYLMYIFKDNTQPNY